METPVRLACLVEDLLADFPGTALTRTPDVLMKHLPQLLPEIDRFRLHLISNDQKFQCALLHYTPLQCDWATTPVQLVDESSDMAHVIAHKSTKVADCELMMPVVTGLTVSAFISFTSSMAMSPYTIKWAQAVTRVLWVCLKLNLKTSHVW